jgi:hypothetical protein
MECSAAHIDELIKETDEWLYIDFPPSWALDMV